MKQLKAKPPVFFQKKKQETSGTLGFLLTFGKKTSGLLSLATNSPLSLQKSLSYFSLSFCENVQKKSLIYEPFRMTK